MSKKLSQSEIDALVASLLTGDAPAEEAQAQPGTPGQPEAIVAQSLTPELGAPVTPTETAQPLVAEQGMAQTPAELPVDLPLEQVQDLGPITQAEVDRALGKELPAPPPVKVAPAAPAVPPAPAPAAVQVAAAASTLPPQTMLPPSNASYAASQAQAAQQTRKALSMAAMRGVLMDIELTVTVELGQARLKLSDVLNLGPGSVITLDKQANQSVDVLVNRVPLMKADILAIGEKYGVRITGTSLNVKVAS